MAISMRKLFLRRPRRVSLNHKVLWLVAPSMNPCVKWFKAQGTGSVTTQAVVRVKIIDSAGGWDIQKKVIVRPP